MKRQIKNLDIAIILVIEVLVIVIGGNLLLRDMARLELEMRAAYGNESSIPAVEVETKDTELVEQPIDTSYIPNPEPVAPVQLIEEEYYDSLEELAICVEAEAGNQSLEGRRMVVAVILNRVDDPGFPNSVKGVIEQKGQFTSFWDGNMAKVKEPSALSIQAVQLELGERKYKEIYFFRGGHYSKYGTPAWKFEDHYFSTR